MAKKTNATSSKSKSKSAPAPAAKAAGKGSVSTEVRNTAIPPKAAASKKEITRDMIAERAYYIWCSRGGSEFDNWCQAERELRTK